MEIKRYTRLQPRSFPAKHDNEQLLQCRPQISRLPQHVPARALGGELRIVKRDPLLPFVEARFFDLTQGCPPLIQLREHDRKLRSREIQIRLRQFTRNVGLSDVQVALMDIEQDPVSRGLHLRANVLLV